MSAPRPCPPYAELAVTTNFSFLRGASHPEELVATAIALKLAGIGIADRNSLAGVVRAHLFLRNNQENAGDFRVITGARLVFRDGTPDILAYPSDRDGLWPPDAAPHRRQSIRAERRVPSHARRPLQIYRWAAADRDGCAAAGRLRYSSRNSPMRRRAASGSLQRQATAATCAPISRDALHSPARITCRFSPPTT